MVVGGGVQQLIKPNYETTFIKFVDLSIRTEIYWMHKKFVWTFRDVINASNQMYNMSFLPRIRVFTGG